MADDYPLTEEEFRTIYGKVPRLTVEVMVVKDGKVLLTLRDIEPYKGFWHLPGGTVYFKEPVSRTVERIAKRELGIQVKYPELVGYIEYPNIRTEGHESTVGMAFKVTEYAGMVRHDGEATDVQWFDELPEKIIPEQRDFILARKVI